MALDYKSELERYRRYYQQFGESARQPKQQAYTTAIFSFLAISLFGWYAIRPTIETILFLQRQIADNKKVSQQMEDKIGKLIDAQATYQQFAAKLPLLDQALPSDPAVIKLVSGIRNLSSNSASISAIALANVPIVAGVATSSAQTVAPAGAASGTSNNPAAKKIADIPVAITLTGAYPDLLNYLNGVINLRRIITIKSISLAQSTLSGGNLPGTVQLRMTLSVNAHYLQ